MRKLLVVIDMQNDFIDGNLGTEDGRRIVGNVVNKIKQYEPENIFATRDSHGDDYLDSREGRFLPVEHCIKGTPGWEIHPEVAEALRTAKIYDKDGFATLELAKDICAIADKEEISIEIIGICTDICVIVNALMLKTHLQEVDISVDASCCAGATPDKHRSALDVLRSCQVTVTNA